MVTERETYNRRVDVLIGKQVVAENLDSNISLERNTSDGSADWRGEVVFAGSAAARYPLEDSFTVRCDNGRSGQTQVTSRAFETSPEGSPSRVIVYFDGVGDPPFGMRVVELRGERPRPRGTIGAPPQVRKDVTIQAPPATARADAGRPSVRTTDAGRVTSAVQLSVIQLADAVEHVETVQRIVKDISSEATDFELALLEGIAVQVDLLSEYIDGLLVPVDPGRETVPWSAVRALEVVARRLLELSERPEAIQLGGALLELIQPLLKFVPLG